MLEANTLTAILAGVGAVIGSGGVVAILHELSIRRKVKSDSEVQKSEQTTELMKYFTDEIKHVNEQTKEQFNKMQEKNEYLIKKVDVLNTRINELVKWVMVDNAVYRAWLENTLRTLDPSIDIPKCADPPISWVNTNNTEQENEDTTSESDSST